MHTLSRNDTEMHLCPHGQTCMASHTPPRSSHTHTSSLSLSLSFRLNKNNTHTLSRWKSVCVVFVQSERQKLSGRGVGCAWSHTCLSMCWKMHLRTKTTTKREKKRSRVAPQDITTASWSCHDYRCFFSRFMIFFFPFLNRNFFSCFVLFLSDDVSYQLSRSAVDTVRQRYL